MAKAERVDNKNSGGREGMHMNKRKQQTKMQDDLGRYMGTWCVNGL